MTKKICNKCGKEMDPWDCISGFHVEMELGFGSKYDGCLVELDLCNNCLDVFIGECAINPIIDLGV